MAASNDNGSSFAGELCSEAQLCAIQCCCCCCDVTQTGNGRACEEPKRRRKHSLATILSFSFSVSCLEESSRPESELCCPFVPAGYLCSFQFGAPPRRTASATAAAALGAQRALSRFHSLTCPFAGASPTKWNGTLSLDASKKVKERRRLSIWLPLLLLHRCSNRPQFSILQQMETFSAFCKASQCIGALEGTLLLLLFIQSANAFIFILSQCSHSVQSMPPKFRQHLSPEFARN